jgi:hypothetical protein
MKEECQYCKHTLSTKSNLTYHQKNNKKCLLIQESISKDNTSSFLKKCEYCDKLFNSNTIKKHLIVCSIKKELDYQNKIFSLEGDVLVLEKTKLEQESKICSLKKTNLDQEINICNLQNKISELETKFLESEKKNFELNTLNIKLQTENNIYEKDHQIISNLAQQPKTTTTNTNNIINNMAVYDNKLITDRFSDILNTIKPVDLYDGQESISRFIAPCLKNDDGTQLYKCTDYSRGVYIKKDKDGNLIKDINGKNLVELIEPIATKKAEELLEEDNNKRDKQRKLKYLKNHIQNQYDELENLKQHIKGYKVESERWKYHNKKIKTIEDDIEKSIEEQEDLETEGIYDIELEDLCDTKLTDGVNDIKNMKKDHTKFSKKLSKILN